MRVWIVGVLRANITLTVAFFWMIASCKWWPTDESFGSHFVARTRVCVTCAKVGNIAGAHRNSTDLCVRSKKIVWTIHGHAVANFLFVASVDLMPTHCSVGEEFIVGAILRFAIAGFRAIAITNTGSAYPICGLHSISGTMAIFSVAHFVEIAATTTFTTNSTLWLEDVTRTKR